MFIDQKFQIICVSETWLDRTIEDDIVSLPDYQLFRKDRDRHGGGVTIYALNSLPVKYLTDLSIEGVEIVSIEVKLLNKKIIIACIYRPPGNRQQVDEFMENFQFVVNIILNLSAESIVIVGDFNNWCISWNDSHCNSELGARFKELIEGNIMFQLINEPTHITPNLQTVLDLIITASLGYILDSGVGHPIGDPYHCYVFSKLATR